VNPQCARIYCVVPPTKFTSSSEPSGLRSSDKAGRPNLDTRSISPSLRRKRKTPMRESATNRPPRKLADKAERESSHINKTFGEIVRQLRHKAGMTIEELAMASKVSRAMLSSVERGEKSPTLSVLTGIASGLNVTLSRLMEEGTSSSVASIIRRHQRLIFRDPESGIERHLLSPASLETGLELGEHVLPSGRKFEGTPRRGMTTDKYVVVLEGSLTVEIEGAAHDLIAEDSMYFRISGDYCFVNNGPSPCRYYLFIVHRRQ
jgi:transcriptional regulator with XRE-family HTH domain